MHRPPRHLRRNKTLKLRRRRPPHRPRRTPRSKTLTTLRRRLSTVSRRAAVPPHLRPIRKNPRQRPRRPPALRRRRNLLHSMTTTVGPYTSHRPARGTILMSTAVVLAGQSPLRRRRLPRRNRVASRHVRYVLANCSTETSVIGARTSKHRPLSMRCYGCHGKESEDRLHGGSGSKVSPAYPLTCGCVDGSVKGHKRANCGRRAQRGSLGLISSLFDHNERGDVPGVHH